MNRPAYGGGRSAPRGGRAGAGRAKWIVLAVVIVVAAATVAQLLRAVPALRVRTQLSAHTAIPGGVASLPWPSQGEATVGVLGVGSLGSYGPNTPTAVASIAKVMTAYVILTTHPLTATSSGPTIAITPSDVVAYQRERAQQDSVLAVAAGEVLTERQALEGMLIPSGDNIAQLLARWDAGSTAAFVGRMNAAAARLGLRHSHFAGPSGLNSATVSTPGDLVRLGAAALRLPAFAAIVAKPQVVLPVAGLAFNVNSLVGHQGVVGIKTGSTPLDGASLLFDAHRTVHGRSVTILGAVLAQQGLQPLAAALDGSLRLINAAASRVSLLTALPAGATVGVIRAPWGGAPIVLTTPYAVRVLGWPGLPVSVQVQVQPLGTSVLAGQKVGTAVVTVGAQVVTLPLVAAHALGGPSLRWRLLRL